MESLLAFAAATASRKYALLFSLLLPAFLVSVLVPIILLRRSSKLKLPPGPRALPFIGHLHLLGANPPRSLCKLSRIHGPLMSLRFGSLPVVVASTATMARQILQVHDQTFSSRFQPAVPTVFHNCQDILFSQPGPYWKRLRKICFADFFATKRLESFKPLITEEVHALLRSILNDNPNKVPVRAKLYAATSNIISRMAVGKRLKDLVPHSQADPSYSLVTLLVQSICLVGHFNVGDYIPCLAWIDPQGYVRKAKAIAAKLHPLWQEIIDARRREVQCQTTSPNNACKQHDFLGVLISASEQRSDVPINDFNIMAILTDMFAAGIDTSSNTIEWALSELLANPSKMKNLQDELEGVVGMSRLVQETDIPHLPYLQAVVKETMRLHPAGPLLAPHKASQKCNISGYDIPAGTLAYVNVWAIGRDPASWERPSEFNPERFLDCKIDVRGQHFELLPFGSGRRACPGFMLGLINVHYMLASITHSFDWSTTEELDMSEKFGLVMTLEKPLIAKAAPRLPKHLFE